MKPGDVVLVVMPGRPLDGCLAVVEAVHNWGVTANVRMPNQQVAPVRLGPENYVWTGGQMPVAN